MSFHSPFDDKQRKVARLDYVRMRSHLKAVRKAFPPGSADEVAVLHAYTNYIRLFGQELLKMISKVDADRLNELSKQASSSFVIYYRLYSPWEMRLKHA
jgi:hypothetical protein